LVLALLAVLFAGLGVWQVQRLAWKAQLIARVDRRVHARPVALPRADELARAAPQALEYLRVQLHGSYLPQGTALVRAVTELGAGYWVMTPLIPDAGRAIYINRGFVPAGSQLAAISAATPKQPLAVIGLLRLSEPRGGFLHHNQPAADRWYSRDVAAIAARRGQAALPQIFVDAQQEMPGHAGTPVAGLTVIHFPDNHLGYALTWFVLAVGALAAALWIWSNGAPGESVLASAQCLRHDRLG
jgi:surfeit locus 1 family protein